MNLDPIYIIQSVKNWNWKKSDEHLQSTKNSKTTEKMMHMDFFLMGDPQNHEFQH